MREIKFRAWDKEQKQMIYGGYVVFGMPLLTDITDLHQTKLGKFPRRDSVLMQFTGLYDKNGKEIYELMEMNHRYRVVFIAPSYVLRDISSGDIIPMYEQDKLTITGEYSSLA